MENCERCGVALDGPSRRVCRTCGVADLPLRPLSVDGSSAAHREVDHNPLIAVLAVLLSCAVVSWLSWVPFAASGAAFVALVPLPDCSNVEVGSLAMHFCFAKLGLLALSVPALVLILVLLFRNALATIVRRFVLALPGESRFLVTPILATLCFTLVWAAAHRLSGAQVGILPQRAFPTLIGVFTFCVTRFGPRIENCLHTVFAGRRRIPIMLRFVIALVVPTAVALAISGQERASQTAAKEQAIVLLSLAVGYFMLWPGRGSSAQTDARSPGRR